MKMFDIIKSFGRSKGEEVDVVDFENDSVAILSDCGTRLYDIRLLDDGGLEITVNDTVKYGNEILDTEIIVKPKFRNNVIIKRDLYDMS